MDTFKQLPNTERNTYFSPFKSEMSFVLLSPNRFSDGTIIVRTTFGLVICYFFRHRSRHDCIYDDSYDHKTRMPFVMLKAGARISFPKRNKI